MNGSDGGCSRVGTRKCRSLAGRGSPTCPPFFFPFSTGPFLVSPFRYRAPARVTAEIYWRGNALALTIDPFALVLPSASIAPRHSARGTAGSVAAVVPHVWFGGRPTKPTCPLPSPILMDLLPPSASQHGLLCLGRFTFPSRHSKNWAALRVSARSHHRQACYGCVSSRLV